MFDELTPTPRRPRLPPSLAEAAAQPDAAQRGLLRLPPAMAERLPPEVRTNQMQSWFAAMLDQIDYPMLLVTATAQVLHANQVACGELDATHPLQLLGDELRVSEPSDLLPLREALQAAEQRGLRRLLQLGRSSGQAVSVAVVPMPALEGQASRAVLLVLGKREVCEALSAEWFARVHGLTMAETQVLKCLCAGFTPGEIKAQQGVAISTVRSQISAIRAKTGAQSIRALVRQVAVLPPLVNALRGLGRAAAAPRTLND